MFVGSIIMALVSRTLLQKVEVYSAVYGESISDEIFWKMMIYVSIITSINSIFVFGFSYIVEASITYIQLTNRQNNSV